MFICMIAILNWLCLQKKHLTHSDPQILKQIQVAATSPWDPSGAIGHLSKGATGT